MTFCTHNTIHYFLKKYRYSLRCGDVLQQFVSVIFRIEFVRQVRFILQLRIVGLDLKFLCFKMILRIAHWAIKLGAVITIISTSCLSCKSPTIDFK